MAMTGTERSRKYRENHSPEYLARVRKNSDKNYREKHKEELTKKKAEWAKAHPEALERYNATRRATYHRNKERAVQKLIEYYYYSWVSPVGADHLFSGDEIWANKDAIRGWLCNKENWSEEDKNNFAKVRKKDIPTIVDGISERVLQQIETNKATLSVEW